MTLKELLDDGQVVILAGVLVLFSLGYLVARR